MSRTLEEFIGSFVVPLLGGGEVHIGAPLRPRDVDQMRSESGLRNPDLLFVRLRRAQELVAAPALDDPDDEELSLWVGLHNLLVFDHPERARVWTRASSWQRLEGATRTFFALPFPDSLARGLARHVSLGAFVELLRTDVIVPGPTQEQRYIGQTPQRRRFRLSPVVSEGREETVRWFTQSHAHESERLLGDALRASPLTCLLQPVAAPSGWSPLWATDYLKVRTYARAICHAWARHKDWVQTGGAVMRALWPSLPELQGSGASREEAPPDAQPDAPRALPGAVVPTGPEHLAAVVGALIHLHFLKVLEFQARLGMALSSRDNAVLSFLGLPLLLPWIAPVTGSPIATNPDALDVADARFEAQTHRRWTEYVDHLQELVPRRIVDNLVASLVPRIVQTA